jgi:PPOX class probable F420-dependent enzyme
MTREFDSLLAEPTVVLTTFRRSGVAVPTGVIFLKIDGRYLFTAPASTGKIKRLAHTNRVTLQAGDKRGRVTGGPIVEAVAMPFVNTAVLNTFKREVRGRNPVMGRVVEIMYVVRRDTRLMYEITAPQQETI